MHQVGNEAVTKQRDLLSSLFVQHRFFSSRPLDAGEKTFYCGWLRRVRPRFVLDRPLTLERSLSPGAESERAWKRRKVFASHLTQAHQTTLCLQDLPDVHYLGARPQTSGQHREQNQQARSNALQPPANPTDRPGKINVRAKLPRRGLNAGRLLHRHHNLLHFVQASCQP
jgi:hypothetical protein